MQSKMTMSKRLSLLFASALLGHSSISFAENSRPSINLKKAIKLAIQNNPELQTYPLSIRAGEAEAIQANQKPLSQINIGAENIAGGGIYSGTDAAEISIAISQTFETDNKSDKRLRYANSKIRQLNSEYQLARLKLIADVGRDYYSLMYLQEQLSQTSEQIASYLNALKLIEKLAAAGAASKAGVTQIEFKLAKLKAKRLALDSAISDAQFKLASNWQSTPEFSHVVGHFRGIQELPVNIKLTHLVKAIPKIQLYHAYLLVSQRQLELAQSEGKSNFELSLGVKRHQISSDQSLQLGFSMPITFSNPNQGNIDAARAKVEIRDLQKEALYKQLNIQLAKYEKYFFNERALLKVEIEELVPLAQKLVNEISQGYQQGQFSVLELTNALSEQFAIQQSILERKFRLNLMILELEEITGQAINLNTPSSASTETGR